MICQCSLSRWVRTCVVCMQRHVLELRFRFSVLSSARLNTEFLLPFLFNSLIIFHEVLESLHILCTFSCAMHYRDCLASVSFVAWVWPACLGAFIYIFLLFSFLLHLWCSIQLLCSEAWSRYPSGKPFEFLHINFGGRTNITCSSSVWMPSSAPEGGEMSFCE